MNKKRIISAVLATALTVTAVTTPEAFPTSLTAYAEEGYKPGDEVKTDFVYLRLLEDNTWEVFWPSAADAPTCQSNLVGKAIPQKYSGRAVTRIADEAFPANRCYTLRSVEIPEGITSIGAWAFHIRSGFLSSVTLPETVTSIGTGAFSYAWLTKMVLPSKLTRIEDQTFDCCAYLESVNIPSGVTYIGKKAFYNCKLKSVEFPPNLKTIGEYAFGLNGEATFSKIPDTVEEIGSHAFDSCGKLTDVIVPDSVKSLGTYAFYHCENLKTAVLPKHFTSIPAGTFNYCSSLTEFTIPDKVESIGNNAFYYCTSLKSIFIPKGVTSIGSEAFFRSGVKDIYYEGTEEDWYEGKVKRGENYAASTVNVHFNCTKPAGVPVEVKINAPTSVNTANLKVKASGNNTNKELTIKDGMLDVSSLANGTYTLTFSANNCAPHAYTVTVSNGTATGLDKIELNLCGDINGDGKLTLGDVLKANAAARNSKPLTGYEKTIADINNDGNITLGDVLKMNAHARNSKLLW